jgi:hypothetical protein
MLRHSIPCCNIAQHAASGFAAAPQRRHQQVQSKAERHLAVILRAAMDSARIGIGPSTVRYDHAHALALMQAWQRPDRQRWRQHPRLTSTAGTARCTARRAYMAASSAFEQTAGTGRSSVTREWRTDSVSQWPRPGSVAATSLLGTCGRARRRYDDTGPGAIPAGRRRWKLCSGRGHISAVLRASRGSDFGTDSDSGSGSGSGSGTDQSRIVALLPLNLGCKRDSLLMLLKLAWGIGCARSALAAAPF